jgi:mannan endo-1,4-beta-mannosidase
MHYFHKGPLVILLIILTVFAGCGGGSKSGGSSNNDDTMNPRFRTKTEELNYIAKLSSDDSSGVISGQNCRHGYEITTGYDEFIERLYKRSGKYVGIIGIDYEYQRIYSLDELKQANTYLKKYWNHGGLVTITWSPANPWGSAKDWSDIQTHPKDNFGFSIINLKELVDDGTFLNHEWIKSLDRIAAALTDLKQAGVIVLWRPMQEMNGNWFWWGNYNSDGTDKEQYKRIWQHMYKYFTVDKGLDNLIWVFSPSAANSSDGSLDINASPYPGDGYVDIIAPTRYNDNLSFDGYNDLVQFAHGKPIALGEYGPDNNDGSIPDGSFDNMLYVQKLKNYPKIAYWVSWHSWIDGTNVQMALADNLNASQLLNDPFIINRDNL